MSATGDQINARARDEQRAQVIRDVHELICTLMQEHKVSRSELSRRLGTSRSNISHVLNGRGNMTLYTLSDIVGALSWTVSIEVRPRGAFEKPTGGQR